MLKAQDNIRAWKQSSSLDELWNYTRKVLFIHDDSLPECIDPEDVLSYHPLLLQPDYALVPNAAFLKGRYGDYLHSVVGGFGRVLGLPKPSASTLRNALLGYIPQRELKQIKQTCDSTSIFHSDRIDISRKPQTTLPPFLECQSKDALRLQDRINARQALTKARIRTPTGRQVDSLEETEGFLRTHGFPVAIRTSSKTVRLATELDFRRFVATSPGYPLWVEEWCPSLYSPNAQVLVHRGKCFPLFVSRQKLNGTTYKGNICGDIPAWVSNKCIDLTNKFVDSLTDYHGIIGIDFIFTATNDILAVDVNARFNSSTIPLWWCLTSKHCHSASLVSFFACYEQVASLEKLIKPLTRRSAPIRQLLFSPITVAPRQTIVGYHRLLWN